MKYKMVITGSAETLFALMSKLLPDELNIEVEEVAEPRRAPDPAIRFEERFDLPKRKPKHKPRPPSIPVKLDAGINRILIDALEQGPMRIRDLQPIVKAQGYSANSTASRMSALRGHGELVQVGDGTWRLADKYLTPVGKSEEAT